jgi:hypothetical protein
LQGCFNSFAGGCTAHCEIRLSSTFTTKLTGKLTEDFSGSVTGIDCFGRADTNEPAFIIFFTRKKNDRWSRSFIYLGSQGS